MMLVLIIAIQMASAGTTDTVHPDQRQLDVMSAKCGTPRKWLKHFGGDEIQFKPSENAKYEKVDCLLKQLRESLVPMKLGFIGNEALPESEKN